MVKTAQEIVKEIREDLFDKIQNLPLSFFDQRTHGELMSRFTSDIDTILEALNNSFAMLIQSFIMIVGTITMIIIFKSLSINHCNCFKWYDVLFVMAWKVMLTVRSDAERRTF